MRERNAFARDVRWRHLAHKRERIRWTGASSSHGAPPPLPPATMLPPQPEYIPPAIQERCIAEFRNSVVFKRKMLDVAAIAFI